MEPLSDPERLRDRDGVAFGDETSVHDRETFGYFASVAGMVAVGITSGQRVLLMESSHGWRLPYGPVAPDEDWLTVGSRITTELTGVPVDITRVERVARLEHRPEDGDERAITYDLVVGTEPLADEPVAADPTFEPWDDLAVEWFETVPEDAYWEHDDAVDDIRLFLE